MNALKKYEEQLAKQLHLPSPRCVYTPDVYWKLNKEQKDTLHNLRRKEN